MLLGAVSDAIGGLHGIVVALTIIFPVCAVGGLLLVIGSRSVRRDIKEAVEKLEKEKKISEDDKKRSLDELEKVTHSETKKIEDLSAAKEKEVLELK